MFEFVFYVFIQSCLGSTCILPRRRSSTRLVRVNWAAKPASFINVMSAVAAIGFPKSRSGSLPTSVTFELRLWLVLSPKRVLKIVKTCSFVPV